MHLFCPPPLSSTLLHPSPFALSPNCHRCMPANSFFLHLSNKSADNSRDRCSLFCRSGKQFKMNLSCAGLGIRFILCMSSLCNGPLCILNKKEKWIVDRVRCQRSPSDQVLSPSLQARQKPPHNPAGVSYACFPVAVVRTGRLGEVEGGEHEGRGESLILRILLD